MNGRLDQLSLLPPPVDTPWTGPPSESARGQIRRRDGVIVEFDLPLFWYEPPWHDVNTETADVVASTVADLGVFVSALRSEISGPQQESRFHATEPAESESDEEEESELEEEFEPLPRIVPYRPERYGLSDRDFDSARIIDVRLTMNRDDSGRFAYSAEQIERWESTPPNEPLAGGGWVPAATFPPDVDSMQELTSKLNQLRALSPTAAIFVSMGPYRLKQELPEIMANQPDGLILRLDELTLDGLQLAMATRHARQLIDQAGSRGFPLWIVPGEITPDDAAKLVACGASGVAIDAWCNEFMEEIAGDSQQSSSSGYSSFRVNEAYISELVDETLSSRIERFSGLRNSMGTLPEGQQMGSLSERWAQALGVELLSLTGKTFRSKSNTH